MIYKPHAYQLAAAKHLLYNPYTTLLADPGTGKTSIILMLLYELKRMGRLPKTLITTMLRVATDVWPEEIAKWDQFRGLTFQVLHGSRRDIQVQLPADIHIINNESLGWLSNSGHMDSYKVLIVDELSKFKNWSSDRTRILKKRVPQFIRRYGLTGSPAPKSLMDLFSQQYIVDGGKSFGRFKKYFKRYFFYDVNQYNDGWPQWEIKPGMESELYKRVAPYSYRLDGKRLLDMPPLLFNDIELKIPDKIKKEAKRALMNLRNTMDAMTSQGVVSVPRNALSAALNASSEYMLARRLGSGIAEGGDILHDVKLKALDDLIDELQGKSALIFFYYRSEGEVLRKRYDAPIFWGGTTRAYFTSVKQQWNAGKVPLLLMQPNSTSHGLNLQHGGNDVIYFSFTDDYDAYSQGYQRIWRQGVSQYVRVHRLISKGTADVAIRALLSTKGDRQQAFLDALADLTHGD